MNKNDMLLEFGCEEIPSTYILPALENMKAAFAEFCGAKRLGFESVETYATPRRLALIAKGLDEKQSDETLEIKGPPAAAALDKDGKFTQVAEKFAASRGAKLSNIKVRDTEKGKYIFVIKKEKGLKAEKVLPELPAFIISKFDFPKTMRWGAYKIRFARPLRWMTFLYGTKAIKTEFEGFVSGKASRGHRFTHNKKVNIDSPATYLAALDENGVVADHDLRRERIEQSVRAAGAGSPLISKKLLNDVLFLVEKPYVGIGHFEQRFLRLPREVLTLCIEKNQHYFPVEDAATKKLLPEFRAVLNVPLQDSPLVIAGYEKVLLARLQDAMFFYENDLKTKLADRVPELGKITFQKELGSLLDKTKRVERLAGLLAEKLPDAGAAVAATRAALLCKTDLTTSLVFEYTDLQGTAGKYYALESGENEAVAAAIEEHYMPRFADDDLPATGPGTALALADKADTVVGYFTVGLIPSGSEDPFQLRRAALGILRILETGRISLKLEELLDLAVASYGEKITPENKAALMPRLLEFFDIRLRTYMESRGVVYDVVNAVDFRRVPGISAAFALAAALADLRKRDEFQSMLEVFTRVSNIMSKSAKDASFSTECKPEHFQKEQEGAMLDEINRIAAQWQGEAASEDEYRKRITDLFSLTGIANDFFDKVMVMDEDPQVRANRLALLYKTRELFIRVADFGKIVKGQ